VAEKPCALAAWISSGAIRRCRNRLGEAIDFAGVDVEPGYRKLFFAIQQSQWKADVSQADDAYAGLMLVDSGLELFQRGI